MPVETEQDKVLLQKWLHAFLADTTDADPDLLSQYIVAIIGNKNYEVKDLTTDLGEFLDDNAAFVSTSLLAAIADNSYRVPLKTNSLPVPTPTSSLPKQPQPPSNPKEPQPIPSRHGPPTDAPTGPKSLRSSAATGVHREARESYDGRLAARDAQLHQQQWSPTKRNVVVGRGGVVIGRDRDSSMRRSASPTRRILINGRDGEDLVERTREREREREMRRARGGTEVGSGDVEMNGSGSTSAPGPSTISSSSGGVVPTGPRNGNMSGPGGPFPNPAREPCRDYHERGYCPRGMACPYEHSEDSIYTTGPPPHQQQPQLNNNGSIQQQQNMQFPPGFPMLPNGMPDFVTAMGSGMMGMHAAGMGGFPSPMIGSPPREGMMPMGMGVGGMSFPGQQGMLGMMPPMFAGGGGFEMGGGRGRGAPGFGFGGRGGFTAGRGRGGSPGPSVHRQQQDRNGLGSAAGPMGGPIDQGRFAGSTQPPKDRKTTTLVITDIPKEYLSLDAIQSHFKRHGIVTNVAIEAQARKALIVFSTNSEAFSAWRDPEPVFGNRHVKVLWHKPQHEAGAAGQAKLAASAVLLENMRKIEEQGVGSVQGTRMTPAQVRQQVEKVKRNALELEKNLAEQKILMAKMQNKTSPMEPVEKKSTIARIRELSVEYDKIKAEHAKDNELVAKILESQTKLNEKLQSIKEAQAEARKVKRAAEEKEGRFEMESLMDAEEDADADPETVALRAHLAALKQHASSLGIDPSLASGTPNVKAAPFIPAGRRTLDNRPTALLLTSTNTSASLPDSSLEVVREFYSENLAGLPDAMKKAPGVGKVEIVQDVRMVDGKVLVSFGSRILAEQAHKQGTTIPPLPPLTIAWHASPISTITAAGGKDVKPVLNASTAEGMDVDEDIVKYKRGEREDDE